MQALIKWRNSLLIKERYMHILPQFCQLYMYFTQHVYKVSHTCIVHCIANTELPLLYGRQGSLVARKLKCWTLRDEVVLVLSLDRGLVLGSGARYFTL